MSARHPRRRARSSTLWRPRGTPSSSSRYHVPSILRLKVPNVVRPSSRSHSSIPTDNETHFDRDHVEGRVGAQQLGHDRRAAAASSADEHRPGSWRRPARADRLGILQAKPHTSSLASPAVASDAVRTGASALQGPPVGRRAAVDLEAEALRTARARRSGSRESTPSMPSSSPRSRKLDQRGRGHRPGQAAPAPRPADADVLEPAAADAERLVLLGPDPVLDDAGDLVAIPGDDPQVGVELVAGVRRLERAGPSISRWPQWSRNASFSASKIVRQLVLGRPVGSRARRAGARRGRRRGRSGASGRSGGPARSPVAARSARWPVSVSSAKAPSVDRARAGPRATRARAPARASSPSATCRGRAGGTPDRPRPRCRRSGRRRARRARRPVAATSRPSTSTRTTSWTGSAPSSPSISSCDVAAPSATTGPRRPGWPRRTGRPAAS